MNVMGIDPGLQNFGWGILSDGKHIENGISKRKAKEDIKTRLSVIFDLMGMKILESKIDVVVLENPFINIHSLYGQRLGYVKGVVLLCAAQHKIEIVEYSTNHVKKVLTGYGHATKKEVCKVVGKKLKVKPVDENSSDALAVALCYVMEAVGHP